MALIYMTIHYSCCGSEYRIPVLDDTGRSLVYDQVPGDTCIYLQGRIHDIEHPECDTVPSNTKLGSN